MPLDPVVNFFQSEIATLPVASGAVTIVISSGDGAKLPNPATQGAFNLTIYEEGNPFSTPEIVRVTARSSDTLTVTRAQEGTVATTKTSGTTWKVVMFPTAKTITDIDTNKVEKTGDTMTGTLTATKLIPSGNVTAGNGMYLPTTNNLAFSTNGVERIRVGSAGNVGIGTNSPASKAVVAGSSTAEMLRIANTTPDSTTPFAGILFNHRQENSNQDTTTAAQGRGGRIVSGREGVYGGSIGNHNSNLQLYTSLAGVDIERLRITSTGNVGIGTTAPATLLDVNGTITGGKFAPTANTTAGNGMYLPTTNTLAFSTNGTEAIRVNASQNVGVKTTTPRSALDVNGDVHIVDSKIIQKIVTCPDSTTTNVITVTGTGDAPRFAIDILVYFEAENRIAGVAKYVFLYAKRFTSVKTTLSTILAPTFQAADSGVLDYSSIAVTVETLSGDNRAVAFNFTTSGTNAPRNSAVKIYATVMGNNLTLVT
jgi:hypothetical protein